MSTLNNSVRLTGYLGGAPKMQLTENQKKFAKISLATNSYRKNNKGENVDEVTWHQIFLWEKHAELAEKYLTKGSKIAIEGRLVNRYYTDKDGAKHQGLEIVVHEIDFLSKSSEN
jgi:single-strand DNA-binding protein